MTTHWALNIWTNQFDGSLFRLDEFSGHIFLEKFSDGLRVAPDRVRSPLGVHAGGVGLKIKFFEKVNQHV